MKDVNKFSKNASSYNKYLEEAEAFFDGHAEEGEAIEVSAQEDRGDCSIYVLYHVVCHKKYARESVSIPVYFISTAMSEEGRLKMYADVLKTIREKVKKDA